MNWKFFIISLLILYAVSLGLYQLLKVYVLKRFQIKKKYLFIVMIILLLAELLFASLFKNSVIIQYGFSILFVVSVLVYMDIIKIEKVNKDKPVVGKPKAKPNRIKDTDK